MNAGDIEFTGVEVGRGPGIGREEHLTPMGGIADIPCQIDHVAGVIGPLRDGMNRLSSRTTVNPDADPRAIPGAIFGNSHLVVGQ